MKARIGQIWECGYEYRIDRIYEATEKNRGWGGRIGDGLADCTCLQKNERDLKGYPVSVIEDPKSWKFVSEPEPVVQQEEAAKLSTREVIEI